MSQFCLFALPLLLVLTSPIITEVANASATFTIVNSCPTTIWPAISPNAGTSGLSTGFALQAGESKTVQAQASSGGRFWARTHCTQDSNGNFSCLTGDCGSGKMECGGGSGVSPLTLAEFQVDSAGGVDYYDISLVDGFNLPILVAPLGSGSNCRSIGCTADLIGNCPSELKMTGDGGDTIGCKSACQVFGTAEYCCNNGTSNCKSSSYSKAFKNACPQAYTYPTDDVNTTFSCSGSVYTITFCPASNASQGSIDGTSIIRPGDQLNSTSKLVSEGGNFTLGFFTVPITNLSYLGIWYTADDQGRKVWVANPNSPILMIDEAQLAMDSAGNLLLFSGGSSIMNVSDQVVTNNNTIAVLLDSGNFILMDSGTGNRTLWQCFDHPTNTLLPAMKIGFNLTTKQNWTLTSWLSSNIPASGAFTLSLERTQNSGQFVIRRRGAVYWTSGPWNNQGFPFLPQLNVSSNRFVDKLNFTSGDDGIYFTFETIGTSLSMLTFSPEGEIIDEANGLILSPYRDFCYGYENDNGCVSSRMPDCRSNKHIFQKRSGAFIGGDSNYDANSSISLSDCMERCWEDCNCNGFIVNSNGTGCVTWANNNKFQADESGQAISAYVLVPVKSSKGKAWIWIVVAVSAGIGLLLLSFICYIKIKKRKVEEEEKRLRDEYIQHLTQSESFKNINEMQKTGREGDLNIFSFGSIMAATNDFSAENKLGEGGFGPVFRGKLPDGREIAVKRLSRTSTQGLVEFKNELILISKLQHTNLVRVLGCCIHEEEKMLIYEYMPNKSLDFFLFAQDKKEQLNWQMRYNIIEGVAQGLLYLHKYSRMRVIHRDLKASNVLLDGNMNPKIADFGMARIFKPNETEAMTNRVVGTYGYMSPEYAMEGTFSIKSDVFSFGVLILEIASGRRNSSFHHFDDRQLNLIGYAWELWKEGVALELTDPALGDSCDVKQLLRSIHVGLLCVQESATDRPTMSEVISMLNNETMTSPVPKPPAYFTGRTALNLDSSSLGRGNQGINLPVSVNDMSISVIEAR